MIVVSLERFSLKDHFLFFSGASMAVRHNPARCCRHRSHAAQTFLPNWCILRFYYYFVTALSQLLLLHLDVEGLPCGKAHFGFRASGPSFSCWASAKLRSQRP